MYILFKKIIDYFSTDQVVNQHLQVLVVQVGHLVDLQHQWHKGLHLLLEAYLLR